MRERERERRRCRDKMSGTRKVSCREREKEIGWFFVRFTLFVYKINISRVKNVKC